MQLLLAIVQDEDATLLCKRLNEQNFRVTRISTVGGFLARGNVTVLVGLEDDQVSQVLETIRSTCHTRRSFINPAPYGTEPVHLAVVTPAMPLEILIGGATVFVFPVRRHVRVKGGALEIVEGAAPSPADRALGASAMNLLLAFVQNEDADQVTRALLEAGYRVTRINTAGAFLRRGNVTLLIGVEEEKVDHVVEIIRASVSVRTEPSPIDTGMPMYGATIFVLEAARLVRV